MCETTVTVVTTYLELCDPAHFLPAYSADPDLRIIQAHVVLVPFYRFLYDAVGREFQWVDRLAWSDAQLHAHLARPSISLHVLYLRGTPAGYIELETAGEEPGTEVAYFGVIPQFHGRGLGKHLLSYGVQSAFAAGAERVWLHTCTLDGPHALANYQARGFVAYRTTTHQQVVCNSVHPQQ
ncbi:MAG TPA: GNAT family N-acetyltransferase [Roseiflexaceae bacterium]|nr:GNAT family N-acetyltransferase [Roseiflexaceae bacterium]HMP39283.1 GNAT family N-acetyltransferase [Roseiflexaceae bacterium]